MSSPGAAHSSFQSNVLAIVAPGDNLALAPEAPERCGQQASSTRAAPGSGAISPTTVKPRAWPPECRGPGAPQHLSRRLLWGVVFWPQARQRWDSPSSIVVSTVGWGKVSVVARRVAVASAQAPRSASIFGASLRPKHNTPQQTPRQMPRKHQTLGAQKRHRSTKVILFGALLLPLSSLLALPRVAP